MNDDPLKFPGIPVVEIVAWHEPTITLAYDIFGGVSVMVDDFEFIHIQYDHRYTSNSHRTQLANQIVGLLGGDPEKVARVDKPLPNWGQAEKIGNAEYDSWMCAANPLDELTRLSQEARMDL